MGLWLGRHLAVRHSTHCCTHLKKALVLQRSSSVSKQNTKTKKNLCFELSKGLQCRLKEFYGEMPAVSRFSRAGRALEQYETLRLLSLEHTTAVSCPSLRIKAKKYSTA